MPASTARRLGGASRPTPPRRAPIRLRRQGGAGRSRGQRVLPATASSKIATRSCSYSVRRRAALPVDILARRCATRGNRANRSGRPRRAPPCARQVRVVPRDHTRRWPRLQSVPGRSTSHAPVDAILDSRLSKLPRCEVTARQGARRPGRGPLDHRSASRDRATDGAYVPHVPDRPAHTPGSRDGSRRHAGAAGLTSPAGQAQPPLRAAGLAGAGPRLVLVLTSGRWASDRRGQSHSETAPPPRAASPTPRAIPRLDPDWQGDGQPVTFAFGGDVHFPAGTNLGDRLAADPSDALGPTVPAAPARASTCPWSTSSPR